MAEILAVDELFQSSMFGLPAFVAAVCQGIIASQKWLLVVIDGAAIAALLCSFGQIFGLLMAY